MKIGLIGLPLTGKTTFFNLLTNRQSDGRDIPAGKIDAGIGIAKIPDKRIDFLTKMYKPKKTIYASVEVVDIPGITPGNAGTRRFLDSVRQADALVHVVRTFRSDGVIHIEGSVDPLRDIETVNMELLFADLGVVENRIGRIEEGKKTGKELLMELEVLKKCREALENGRLIHSLGLSEDEKWHLKSFDFLTERPMILLMNLDEEQFRKGEYDGKASILKYAEERKIPAVEASAKIELEINGLEDEDRRLFMEDLGIRETGIARLAAAAYDYLGLISFITVGEDEVRAWPVKKGICAREAAGKIHSDLEKGFIRAEVVKYNDLEKLGSMAAVKEKGLYRLEGGDIVNIRFNV